MADGERKKKTEKEERKKGGVAGWFLGDLRE